MNAKEIKQSVCLTALNPEIHHATGYMVTNTKYNKRIAFDEYEDAITEYKKQVKLNSVPKSRKRTH